MVDYHGLRISLNNFIDAEFPDVIRVYDENFADPNVFEDGSRWLSPVYGSCDPESHIKKLEFFIYVFSKSDPEGLELSKIITRVVAAFYDNTKNDGKRRIPFYSVVNGSLVQKSTILSSDLTVEQGFNLTDSTKAQAIRIELSWC